MGNVAKRQQGIFYAKFKSILIFSHFSSVTCEESVKGFKHIILAFKKGYSGSVDGAVVLN